jgi:hypothetical protein
MQRGNIIAAPSARWPNNVVPYIIEAAFTDTDRAIIAAVRIFDHRLQRADYGQYPCPLG